MNWLTNLLYGRERSCELSWKCSFCCHVDKLKWPTTYRNKWRNWELGWAHKTLHAIHLLRCEKCGVGSMYINDLKEFEVEQ